MGFKKMFSSASSPAVIVSTPAPVTETVQVDTQADYTQRASRKRGLLSTILTKRKNGLNSEAGSGGNKTLG